MCNHVLITASCTEAFIIKALVDSESDSDEKFVYLVVFQAVVEEMIGAQYREWQRGNRDPVSRTNFNKIHASRFESVIVGETSGKRNFHDQTQIIHESRIPHEINHASHAFSYSRITFFFK